MKRLLALPAAVLLAVLVPASAGAETCVIGVFHHAVAPPPGDYGIVAVAPADVLKLRAPGRIAVLQLRYENPVGNQVRTTYSGHESFGIGRAGPRADGRTGLVVSSYSVTPDFGRRDIWYFVDAAGQSVEGVFNDQYPASIADTVLDGLDVNLQAVPFTTLEYDTVIDGARALADAASCPVP